MTTHSFEDGKYEITRNPDTWEVTAKRHGEDWPAGAAQFVGNKMLHAMLSRFDELAANAAPAGTAPAGGNWIAADDVNRLVRELDVCLNGEAGAAAQASLSDVVAQVRHEAAKRGQPLLAAPAANWCKGCTPDSCMGCHIPSNNTEAAPVQKENKS